MEQPPENLAHKLGTVIESNVRGWALEESRVGRLARAILRAKRDGDAETAHRLATLILPVIIRWCEKPLDEAASEDGFSYEPFLPSDMRAVSEQLATLRKPRRTCGPKNQRGA
jgi:hypothetical protein